jgi:hypothetical protein
LLGDRAIEFHARNRHAMTAQELQLLFRKFGGITVAEALSRRNKTLRKS